VDRWRGIKPKYKKEKLVSINIIDQGSAENESNKIHFFEKSHNFHGKRNKLAKVKRKQ
jgi:hypothetical protein